MDQQSKPETVTKKEGMFKKIFLVFIKKWTGGIYGEQTRNALRNNTQVLTTLAMTQLDIIRSTSSTNTIMQLQILFIKESGLERQWKSYMKKNGYKIEKYAVKEKQIIKKGAVPNAK